MDEEKAADILEVNDSDIQEYLKKHSEKAQEIGQSLIELDKHANTAKDNAQVMEPLNIHVSSTGGAVHEEPVYYLGLFKTPIIIAFIIQIVIFILIEIIAFLVTKHF